MASNPSAATWAGSTTALVQSPLQRTFYAAGLFGLEGQDTNGDGTNDGATIGFFTPDQRVALTFDPAVATAGSVQEQLNAGAPVQFDPATGAVVGTTYADLFGADTALLPLAFSPQGIFWDNDNDPSTDGVLMAAYLNGQWVTYRALNADGSFAVVDPSTLGLGIPAGGTLVPDPTGAGTAVVLTQAQIDALLANPIYSQDVVEDISKVNANFGIDIADLDGFNNGEFTIRVVPVFAPVVAAAVDDYQFDIAANLDAARVPFLALDPELDNVATAIEALPAAQRSAAIAQTGFGFLSAFDALTNGAARNQMDNAFFRIDGSRYGTGFGAASVDGQNSHTYNDAFSVFFAGGGFYGSNDARADSMGFDYNSWSASVGGDVKLSDTLLLGSAFGFTSGSANVDGGVGSLDADTYSFTGYFGSNWANGFYLDGALGYAFSDYNSSRTVSIGAINNTYEGDTTGHSILARVQAGYDYENDGWKIGPVGDLSIVHTKVGDFTEAGGGVALNVGSQDISSVQGGFGLRTDYRLKQDWGSLVMRGKAMVVHEFGDTDRTVNTSFVGGLPAGWNTPVTTGSDTFVLLNAGISAVLANNGASNIALGLDYNGRIGDGVSEHRGTVSVKFLW